MSFSRSRTIKLFCPSLSKVVGFVVLEDHGLDLGTIARTFGLDPSTLKLNGHFLSRGSYLISSVTWKSLLSFFTFKGFSTGSSDRDAIVIDGKACDYDTGWHNPLDGGSANRKTSEDNSFGIKRKAGSDDVNLLKKRKMDQCKSGELIDLSNAVPSITQYTYTCVSRSLKRPREEEEMVLTTTPSKRR